MGAKLKHFQGALAPAFLVCEKLRRNSIFCGEMAGLVEWLKRMTFLCVLQGWQHQFQGSGSHQFSSGKVTIYSVVYTTHGATI